METTSVESVEHDSMGKKKIWSQWIATFFLSIIVFVIGLSNGWGSPYLAKLSLQDSVDGMPKVTDEELAWVASLMNIGRMVGAIAGAVIQDTIGRKNALYFAGIPMMSGWICIALAPTVQWLFAARVLIGFSMGIVWTTMSHFLAEIANAEIRGSLIIWNSTMHSMGVFVGNLIGPYISMRIFAYICLLFNGSFLLMFALIPESPYRYIMLNDMDRAEKSLQWFRRTKDVKSELKDLHGYISSSAKSSWSERWQEFNQPRYRKSFLTMLMLDVTSFFAAYNVMTNFMEIIITKSQVTITPSTVVTICGLFSIISSFTATFLVDKFGRRFLLISSSLGIALSQTCLGIHFKLLDLEFDATSLTWLPFASIFVYVVLYCSGISCVPNALIGELFSPRLKSIASLAFIGIDALQASLVNGVFVQLINMIGEAYVFWFLACGMYLAAAYFYYCLPETMGKSLKDIQKDEKK